MRKKFPFSLIILGFAATILTAAPSSAQTAAQDELLPPNAQAGECYARVWVPATYKTEKLTVLTREASEKIEIIPAKYEWAEEKVLVKEGYERLEVVPATYNWVEEKVLVQPAGKRLVTVPAEYEWVEDKILVKEAQTVWKKGKNPAHQVKNGTGEIMCLVEVPATYKTVKKKALKTPARTEERELPAEYATVKKRVVAEPFRVERIEVPAEYKTVKVKKLVSPPQEKRVAIPEQSDIVTKRIQVTEGQMEWRAILCETNMQAGLVTKLQRSLNAAGHHAGPVDGVLGGQTWQAIESFQKAKGLARGGLTMETLKALGIDS